MTNRRSTWGGAITAFGVTLIGVGHLPSKDSDNIQILFYIELFGYICTAIGALLTALFAADAASLKGVAAQVQQNRVSIQTTARQIESGDTKHLQRDIKNAISTTTKPK